jgi:hypothetical protein
MTFWDVHHDDRDAFEHDLLVEEILDDPEDPSNDHEPAAPDEDRWCGGPWATP